MGENGKIREEGEGAEIERRKRRTTSKIEDYLKGNMGT